MEVDSKELFVRKYNDLRSLNRELGVFEGIRAAAILRHLLLDDNPLLHLANRTYKLKIVFKVDNSLLPVIDPLAKILFIGTEIGEMKQIFSRSRKELKIDQFLGLEILEIEQDKFSTREIIKFAANKKGGVHLANTSKADEEKLDNALQKVGKNVLLQALFEISNIALIALLPLKEKIIELPKDLPYLAHYNIGPNKSLHLKGENQHIVTNKMNEEIDNGFGILLETKIMPQKKGGNRFIYAMGGNNKTDFNYSLTLTNDGDLVSTAKLNSNAIIKTRIQNFSRTFSGKWISIACFLNIEEQKAVMSLFCNNHLYDSEQISFKKINTKFQKHVIAGNLNGKQNASMYFIEQILLKGAITVDQQSSLLNYMEGNWKK
ncbi:MAG: hypothetical protein KDC02_13350 [Flavobacteriales bacterium]|nr:hypothetical protein [Flavobacteriales bacterium]